MRQLGVRHRVSFIGQHEDEGYENQHPSDIPKEVESNDEEEEEKIIKTKFLPEIKKRKRLSLSELREVKEESCERQSSRKLKTKKHESRNRWSAERYESMVIFLFLCCSLVTYIKLMQSCNLGISWLSKACGRF